MIPESLILSLKIFWRKHHCVRDGVMQFELWVRAPKVNVLPVCLCRTACGRCNFWLPGVLWQDGAGKMERGSVRAAIVF